MRGDVFMDGGGEFRDAGKDAVAQQLGGDVPEDPFHHVQPGGRDRCEVEVESGVFIKPFYDLGVLLDGVVVIHQMHFLPLGLLICAYKLTHQSHPFAPNIDQPRRTTSQCAEDVRHRELMWSLKRIEPLLQLRVGEETLMITAFLQETFRRFSGNFSEWHKQAKIYQSESGVLIQAVEHIVDQTTSQLRAIPGYRRRLKGPVADAFLYIDDLVERIPRSFLCSRSTFSLDPRVRAFFVNPHHLQEVFSQNKDVRKMFDANALADECCALMCMHMKERQKFGVALIGDRTHREVLQTTISFRDHQVYSPGVSEADARRALKCCIFNGILTHIREKLIEAKTSHIEHRKRLSMLRIQLRKAEQQDAIEKEWSVLRMQIEELENTLINAAQRPPTLEDRLAFVSDVLRYADQFISASFQHLHLTHMGIKVDQESKEPAYEFDIAVIRIGNKEPRVAALVRFPRCELLPKPEFLLQTDSLFAV